MAHGLYGIVMCFLFVLGLCGLKVPAVVFSDLEGLPNSLCDSVTVIQR